MSPASGRFGDNRTPIEEYFLTILLRITLFAILIFMSIDYTLDRFFELESLVVNVVILLSTLTAMALHWRGYFTAAVLCIGGLIIMAMCYQSVSRGILSTSMGVILVVGFGFSILLKGRLPVVLHFIVLTAMITLTSVVASRFPNHSYGISPVLEGVTFLILYCVTAYSSLALRRRYDFNLKLLSEANHELVNQSHEIEAQNEELQQSQQNLFELNNHLEQLVETRTLEVNQKNERLTQYAYTNAHHLRGPVARILGLVYLARIDSSLSYEYLCNQIEVQAHEIDTVINKINEGLET